MPIYTCLKCGHQVRSKNIHTRSRFPVDRDMDTMSIICLSGNSYIKEVDDEHRPNGKDAMIRITKREDQTIKETIKEFIDLFTGMSDTGREHYLCGAIEGHKFDEGDSPPTA